MLSVFVVVRNGDSPIHYDETVDSAMHIYEKLRRSRSGSLPSRRVKKTRHQQPSSSSLITNNLSALNLSRAEELRTAKDLEEIKRALLALQQNSLGLLSNIQYENSGPSRARAELPPSSQENNPGLKPRKTRGVYSVSSEQLTRPGPRFSLPTGGRKTTSTTNLIASGTESDNSYAGLSSVSASSRASSSLSGQMIRTQELPHINSSIIEKAHQLPLSLTGLISPRHMAEQRPALPPPPPQQRQHAALISPARMYHHLPSNLPSNQSSNLSSNLPSNITSNMSSNIPSNLSPSPAKSGLVYLRQDQNIPDNFCDKFRPIQPAGQLPPSQDSEAAREPSEDIVVTLHSVHV